MISFNFQAGYRIVAVLIHEVDVDLVRFSAARY